LLLHDELRSRVFFSLKRHLASAVSELRQMSLVSTCSCFPPPSVSVKSTSSASEVLLPKILRSHTQTMGPPCPFSFETIRLIFRSLLARQETANQRSFFPICFTSCRDYRRVFFLFFSSFFPLSAHGLISLLLGLNFAEYRPLLIFVTSMLFSPLVPVFFCSFFSVLCRVLVSWADLPAPCSW